MGALSMSPTGGSRVLGAQLRSGGGRRLRAVRSQGEEQEKAVAGGDLGFCTPAGVPTVPALGAVMWAAG